MAKFGNGRRIGLAALAVAAALALAGCGGGDNSAAASAASTDTTAGSSLLSSPASNSSATTLSGSPATIVAPGAQYSFVPQLQPAGSATGFSISNKPAWANFSVVTGELSGTPGNGDVGNFTAIVISAVTAGGTAALPAFAIKVAQPPTATSGSATLAWVPPTVHTDGSSLSNLGGYNIYFGDSADALTNKIQVTNPGLTAYTVSGLGAGTHVFGITAYSTAGLESDLAIVGSKTIM